MPKLCYSIRWDDGLTDQFCRRQVLAFLKDEGWRSHIVAVLKSGRIIPPERWRTWIV